VGNFDWRADFGDTLSRGITQHPEIECIRNTAFRSTYIVQVIFNIKTSYCSEVGPSPLESWSILNSVEDEFGERKDYGNLMAPKLRAEAPCPRGLPNG